jgi:predicted RNA binding protein YcfA (HicA-like mRNA interferase family)
VRALGKFEKLLLKAKNNPKHVRFEELDKILIRAGFKRRQCRKGSIHYIYSKGTERVTVPFDQPHVKAKYVELVIKALEGEIDNE